MIFRQDSVTIKHVSVDTVTNVNTRSDTSIKTSNDSSIVRAPIRLAKTHAADSIRVKHPNSLEISKTELKQTNVIADTLKKEHIAKPHKNAKHAYERFVFYSDQDSIFTYKSNVYTNAGTTSIPGKEEMRTIPHFYQRIHLNWTLFIAFTSVLLLMALKSYYQKFVTQVISTIVNFQLAEKMLREKNILVRRAFFMLNLNFFFIFSLFLLLTVKMFGIKISGNYPRDYLYICLIVLTVLLIRLFLVVLLGFVFEVRSTTTEYIHNIYLINKNIGLILLPLVFAAIYTNNSISRVILIAGLVIVFLGSIYKIIRGLQIIMKNGVLLFYSFLYLCTLELLPLVLGSKLLLTLS